MGFDAIPDTPSPVKKTQSLSCPPAPVGVIDVNRADVSFVVGMVIDKFDHHLPLYRQHRRLDDAGIRASGPWLTQLMQSAVALLEPVYAATRFDTDKPGQSDG